MSKYYLILFVLTGLPLSFVQAQTPAPTQPATTTALAPLTTDKAPQLAPDDGDRSILGISPGKMGLPTSISGAKGKLKNMVESTGVPTSMSAAKGKLTKATDGVTSSLSATGQSAGDALGLGKSGGLSDLFNTDLGDLGLKVKEFKKKRSERRKKAKTAKTEYEGLPMIKAYTKIGSGDRTVVEEFYVLKNYQAPSPYVREVFWYDLKGGRVSSSAIKEKEGIYLLHGPYKRYQNGELMEEGYYYAGTKDGRWEKYDAKFMLLDKTRWHHGFPADSRITYYDSTHTKIKEVIPIEYGKVKGQYLAFYENGLPAEEGKYENDQKVGRWTDYYPTTAVGRRRKRLTQYARDGWDTAFEPYVISEWDDRGKATYERPKDKAVAEEEADN